VDLFSQRRRRVNRVDAMRSGTALHVSINRSAGLVEWISRPHVTGARREPEASTFHRCGQGVAILHTQASDNGHWAFLWLRTKDAAPQMLWVTASNAQGRARSAFALKARDDDPKAHRGFSPRMRCI